MIDKTTNILGLEEFAQYMESQHYMKFNNEIMTFHAKFKETFTQLWNQIENK
jgi:hypothetical protein